MMATYTNSAKSFMNKAPRSTSSLLSKLVAKAGYTNTITRMRELQTRMAHKSSNQAQADEFASRVFTVSGERLVDGIGEVVVDVNFPVSFTQKPLMQYGSELDANQTVSDGSFPTVGVTVLRYNIKRGDLDQLYYIGATLAISITGSSSQKTWLHYHVSGKGITNSIT